MLPQPSQGLVLDEWLQEYYSCSLPSLKRKVKNVSMMPLFKGNRQQNFLVQPIGSDSDMGRVEYSACETLRYVQVV